MLTSSALLLYDLVRAGGNLTYSVYGLSGQPLAFGDVSTSSQYGSAATTDASALDPFITITLNEAALAAIAADQGGNLFLGGIDSGKNTTARCTSIGGCFVGDVAASNISPPPLLTLTTVPAAVPEPSSAALVGTMILLLVALVTWRQKARAH